MHFTIVSIWETELKRIIIIDTTSHDNLDNVQEVSQCFSGISLYGSLTTGSPDVHSPGSPPTNWRCTRGFPSAQTSGRGVGRGRGASPRSAQCSCSPSLRAPSAVEPLAPLCEGPSSGRAQEFLLVLFHQLVKALFCLVSLSFFLRHLLGR